MSSLGSGGSGFDATLAAPDSIVPRRAAPTSLERGQSVGRYVVLERVGQGGMGIVYAAYDPELDRRVALKLLAPGPDGGTKGGEDRSRLLREAQAMAKLTHPHVVTVHDAGTHDGAVFLAMEFVEGGTLGARMQERPDWRVVLPLFLQAGSGLAAAHAAGLVHRDFKPDNVLVGRDGVAKVSDFGLARAVGTAEIAVTDPDLRPVQDALSGPITRVGALVGTPAYMAPEQHMHRAADACSDQFAFCVALFEALYGTRPFVAKTLSELVYAITTGRIVEPPADTAVPNRLRRIVVRGLATDPDQRWPSMAALLDELRVDPSRRRVRRIAAVTVGVVVLGGLAGLAALDRRERQLCRREAAAVHALWNDARREGIAAALRATDVPFAEPTITRIEALLGPWTAQWAEVREQVCLAAADDPDDDGPPLQRTCLDERLVQLEVALEQLDGADAPIAREAVHSIAGLPRIERCHDVTWLRRDRGPVDADDGAGSSALAVQTARLSALVEASRFADARALADELAPALAERPALQAAALYELANADESEGRPVEAVERLREAYFLAGRHHADRVAALAAIDLTMLVGVRMGDLTTGRSWAEHATMLVDRDPDPELRIELLYAVGALEHTAEHAELAIGSFREQVELATEVYGDDHPETAYAHIALGNALSAARPGEARAEYERAREIWVRTLGDRHPHTATVIYSLGNLDYVEGRYADALARHREALALREAALDPRHPDLAASLDAIGSLLGQAGDSVAALAHHRRALAILESHFGAVNPRVLGGMHNVAQDLIDLERWDEAEATIGRRCVVSEQVRDQDPQPWVQCQEDRAELAERRGRFHEAVLGYEAALRAAEPLFGPRHAQTGTHRFLYGRALVSDGDAARGRKEIEQALAIWRETRPPDHPEILTGLRWLGRAELADGDALAAVTTVEQALALVAGDGIERASLQLELAEALWAAGDRGRARGLAATARDALAGLGDAGEEQHRRATQWLADHP